MTKKEHEKEVSNKSELLSVKEKFYEEENISPEVQKVLDDVFNEMIGNEPQKPEFEEYVEEPPVQSIILEDDVNSDIIKEKEKFYSDVEVSPEVRKVIDDVFNEMISPETAPKTSEINKELEDPVRGSTIKEVQTESKKSKPREKSEDSQLKQQELDLKLKLEQSISKYQELIANFEEKTKDIEDTKLTFENRLKELDETKLEFEERGQKLEQARSSFMQLSSKLEEKKFDIEQREKNLSQLQRELDRSKLKIDQEKKALEKAQKQHKKQDSKDKEALEEQIEIDIMDNQELLYPAEVVSDSSELVQMERGKVEILKDILQQLSYHGNFQSCFLIDGQGMIISEYSKKEMDVLAIGAMFSLICTTVLRTVRSLSLSELEYFKLSSLNGEFIIRNIDIANYERNFILLAYFNDENSTIPSSTTQKLNRKQIRRIVKSIKTDFYELRHNSKISWVLDNIVEKVDFLKQKYYQVEGDVNLIRLNLMNKASIKIRELFEN